MRDPEIVAVRWWTHGSFTIGAVAVLGGEPPRVYWKAYIGVGNGFSEKADMLHIFHTGAKLMKDDAVGLFPTIAGTYEP